MSAEQDLQPDAIEEQLVAYLDQELDPDEMERVEQRLRVDPEYQLKLQQLERAWDLLDDLDRAEAGEKFTQSTVGMVALTASEEAEASAKRADRSKRLALWASLGGVLAAGLVGFLAVHAALSKPNRELLKDLPVIESIDEYRYAESIEFLERLDQEGLFGGEVEDAI